ncbi:MAG: hypothetical protein RLZ12_101 [Bacillota bacterium]|jgi:acetyl-CoA carboxylase biotin carboxyl carrier protein
MRLSELNLEDLRKLIKLIDDSTISEFKLDNNAGTSILIKKKTTADVLTGQYTLAPPMAQTIVQTPDDKGDSMQEVAMAEELQEIVAPMVGTFYRAASPGGDPYIKKGDQVEVGQVVCIVEAMKLMNEIESEFSGEVIEVLAENGQLVEYGQPLFSVKKR